MTMREEPPFRADHVGSLLRPQRLLDARAAHAEGRIDDDELRGIAPFYARTAPNLTVATYFASRQYIEENPGIVDRFTAAMEKSLQYASEHPDEVRDVLTEYTEIPPEAAKAINLPSWKPELTEDTIQRLAELSQEYGLIEEQPDLDQLIRR